jgi:hypothetical protein
MVRRLLLCTELGWLKSMFGNRSRRSNAKLERLLGIVIVLICAATTVVDAQEPGVPHFESDIRPILREYCLDCHGATEKLEGGLDLRLVRFMQLGGDSGAAIAGNDPESSLLWQRVFKNEMPPGEAKVSPEKKEILRRWLVAGAPTLRAEPEQIGPGVPLTEEERSYWAYQPIRRPAIALKSDSRARTQLDSLIENAMPKELSFSPDASRLTLIRRVYIDLLGLMPTAEQVRFWSEHTEPSWYEQMVDQVLQSPAYGERWARHWLDAAGYADSDGVTLADAERPWAWQYRDYVIRSLNDDKPLDRFIVEQLAGDELAGAPQGDWNVTQIECLTATGFLRMAADGTGSGDNSPESRNRTIADTLQIVGSTLLGSSLNCAQCHDHRYDPISHRDYFAIRAIFEPAFDWQNWKTPNERLVSLYTAADRQQAASLEEEAQKIAQEKNVKQTEYMQKALAQELMKYEEPLRSELRTAYETPGDKRTDQQKMLLDKNPSVNISPGVLYQYLPDAAEDLKKYDARIAEVRGKKPIERFLQVLSEPANHSVVTKLFHRGDFNQPMQEIKPGKLAVLVPEGDSTTFADDDTSMPTTGRRLAFARWLTRSDQPNPLLIRSLVNRVWMHHFGKGIVATPGDFGRLGNTPSHPEVLQWLATELVDKQWSLKELQRIILTSTVYRQSSARNSVGDAVDPDNLLYWRKPIQRLDAEVVRDTMLQSAGELNRAMFGAPLALIEDDAGQVSIDPNQPRRSIYAKWRRTQPVALLQTFDAPVMGVNCDVRPASTVATQALMLMNGDFSIAQAQKLAKIIRQDANHSEIDPKWQEDLAVIQPPVPTWQYGTGKMDYEKAAVESFQALSHFTGSQWQAGPALPDPNSGWVLLHAQGGHPGNKNYPTIRRWIAPADGNVSIEGSLGHGSENGDGVEAMILHKGSISGRWAVKHATAATPVGNLQIMAGDTVDFVVHCREHETSDSFTWNIEIKLMLPNGATQSFASAAGFRGPTEDYSKLAGQLRSAWLRVYFRPPTADEMELLIQFAQQQIRLLQDEPQRVPSGSTVAQQVLVNVCQTLLNSNEFLYVD